MPTTDEKQTGFEGWVILELMGHRRLAGFLSEQAIGGASFLRIDVPAPDGKGNTATQFYTGSAVYCITPVTEELARKVAANAQPAPVTQWDIQSPALPAPRPSRDEFEPEDDE
jgi:hypothetical protein